MPDEMVSFESAMQELQFTEEELQKLVASGALRAFRSGGEMKFRGSDLEAVKKERETEPTIIIPSAGIGDALDSGDDLQIDMPDDLGIDESAQTVVGAGSDMTAATVSIPEQGTEELVFDDQDLEVLPLEEDAASTQAAEAATIVESAGEITVADGSGVAVLEDESPSSSRRQLSSRIGSMSSRRKSAAYEVRGGNPAWTAMLVLSAAVALFALSILGTTLLKGYSAGTGPDGQEEIYIPGFLQGVTDKCKDIGKK
jgi:hypothetical protein